MAHLAGSRGFRRAATHLLLLVTACLGASAQDPVTNFDSMVLTNGAQILSVASSTQPTLWPLRTEATALFTSSTETVLGFSGDSKAAFLPTHLQSSNVRPGGQPSTR